MVLHYRLKGTEIEKIIVLDGFHFRWLENSIIDIGKAVSNPLMFNQLN